MCLCMLMHAGMDHGEHQHNAPTVQSAGAPSVASETRCAHCGHSLQSNYTFCPNCGMKLQESHCPACGQTVETAWKACAFCGSPLREGASLPA